MITTPTKLAIAIDLDQLRVLTREYLAQLPPRDRLESQLRMSVFLAWLRKRRKVDDNVLEFNLNKEIDK